MKEQLEKIKEEALRQIESSEALGRLNDIRISHLGKKGELTNLLKSMKDAAPEDQPKVSQMVNDVRGLTERRLEEAKTALAKKAREEQLERGVIDTTPPARKNNVGHSHLSTIALEEVERISVGVGYEIVEGSKIECDRHDSEKLNILKGYPARGRQDTFYINENILLCSQTSPIQVRTMEKGRLPIRTTAPGRVFRSNEADATHSPSFHQVEGPVIDRNITFANLKGTLTGLAKELFGPETRAKFHPRHFPLTEPSAGVDMARFRHGGSDYRFCKSSDWIEILGCGMVYPHIPEMHGVDPNEYSGFAFGVGPERIALPKYEIDDMRLLYEDDIRFLEQS